MDLREWLRGNGDIATNDRAAQWKAVFHEDFAPIMRKRVKGFNQRGQTPRNPWKHYE